MKTNLAQIFKEDCVTIKDGLCTVLRLNHLIIVDCSFETRFEDELVFVE